MSSRALEAGEFIIDLRSNDEYIRAGLPGAVNIAADDDSFLTYVGWFVDYDKPIYLIVPSADAAPGLIAALRTIGVDNIDGYFTPDTIRGETVALPGITAHELAQRLPKNGLLLLDVRGRSEYHEQHVAGACNIPLGYLSDRLDQIPRDRTVVVQCMSGFRSTIAASLLRSYGFDNIVNLVDGIDVWSTELATESAQETG